MSIPVSLFDGFSIALPPFHSVPFRPTRQGKAGREEEGLCVCVCVKAVCAYPTEMMRFLHVRPRCLFWLAMQSVMS